MPKSAVTFGFDQSRDAFIVQQIIGGNLKILGPPVSELPGIFHGVFYYYVVAPAYFFGHGSPVTASYWMSFINALGVFVIYLFTLTITGKKLPSLISSLLFAFSFEATQYATWLSNVSLAAIFVPLIYFGLWIWLYMKKGWGSVITGLALGLSIQCNFSLAYHILPVVFWLYSCRKSLNLKSVALFVLMFVLSTSSMIVSELKFNQGGVLGIWHLLSSQDKLTGSVKLGEFIVSYLNQIGNVFSLTLFPLSKVFGGLVGLVVFAWAISTWSRNNKRKIFSWQTLVISPLIGYSFALSLGGGSTPHITVGIAGIVSVVFGILIWRISNVNKFLAISILILVLSANLTKIILENKNGQTTFSIQKDMVLFKELGVVDYTYQAASGKEFSISTTTIPLYTNTTWSYLYNWYGKSKYGYLPYWVGRDQIGLLGNNLQISPQKNIKHFYIIEPTYGIPDIWVKYANSDQDAISRMIKEQKFGDIVVQEREIKNK